MNPPRAVLDAFATALNDLQAALAAERSALECHNAEQLAVATDQKTTALETLGNPKFGAALSEQIAGCDDSEREDCEQRHNDCLTLARQLKDFNLVNGKILNRSQNSVREIINILSGKRPGGLYGESGQPTSDSQAGGSIAKA